MELVLELREGAVGKERSKGGLCFDDEADALLAGCGWLEEEGGPTEAGLSPAGG